MADGTEVVGLTRRPDGRWRVSATGETFSEADEHLAIARFEALVAGNQKRDVLISVDTDGLPIDEAIERASSTPFEIKFSLTDRPRVKRAISEAEFWAAVRQLILEKPK